jgi:hypothetical protein
MKCFSKEASPAMPSFLGREAVLNQQTHASLGDSAPAYSWLIANVWARLAQTRAERLMNISL